MKSGKSNNLIIGQTIFKGYISKTLTLFSNEINFMKKLLCLSMHCFVLLSSTNVLAQKLSGTVTGDGSAQASVSVTARPSSKGTTTNSDGKYSLTLAAGTYKITFSETGFTPVVETVTIASGEDKTLDVVLVASNDKLDEILVVGTRSLPRSSGNSPLPIDNFKNTNCR